MFFALLFLYATLIQRNVTLIAVNEKTMGYYIQKGVREDDMTGAGALDRELQQKIDAYADMLFRLSLIRLQNVQDAEDVVQEAFYQYVKHGTAFESPEHEKAWLLKVTLNACRKIRRSAWSRKRSDGDWQEVAQERQKTGQTGSEPEEDALRKERNRRLLKAVWDLPEKYRDVIHLFYYQELSVREIAGVTGRAESTVTSQLTRARELLRRSLKEEFEFE